MLSLDHIVFAGRDIQAATKEYGDIALKSVKGGEHVNWGTYNYLAYFSNNCYLEWLTIYDAEKAEASENPLIQHLVHVLTTKKQGPFQFALRTTDLDAYVDHFQKNQIEFFGPIDASRQRPDGSILRWRMLFPTYDYSKETLPFLIEWGESESERFDVSLVNSQAITEIQFGGIDKERFQQIYQLRPRPKTRNRTFRLKNATIKFSNDPSFSMTVS